MTAEERMEYVARVRAMTPDVVHELVFQREMARQSKDWAAADAVRQQLAASGVVVVDAPGGPTVDAWCDWAREQTRPAREAAGELAYRRRRWS